MAWRRIADKPLSEPTPTWFTDAYMRHQGEMLNCLFRLTTSKTPKKTFLVLRQVDFSYTWPVMRKACPWHDVMVPSKSNENMSSYVQHCAFLHERPRIWPWIKTISNELNTAFRAHASYLLRRAMLLWRYQQSIVTSSVWRERASETRGRCVKIVVFTDICGLVKPCKKENNVCALVANCLCAYEGVILVFISLVASQVGE